MLEPLTDFFPSLITFLNSNFVLALLASMAGAYFGATAAQKVIQRTKKKEELERELRYANSVIALAVTVCNMALGLKRQIVKPLVDTYKQEQERFEKHHQISVGQSTFNYSADFQNFGGPSLPIKSLKDILFKDVNATNRALSAVAFLDESASGLIEMLSKRRDLIEDFKRGDYTSEQLAFHYFGLKMPSGNTYREYSDSIHGMEDYLDNVIFFSKLISEDIEKYSQGLKEREKLIPSDFSINGSDFSVPEEMGLIPSEESYSDWLSGFDK
jgi:hypothetical protein